MVWTAEPGIDVTAWPAVVVRAYTESFLLASITRDDKYLYPGFAQSVDPNKSIHDPISTQFLWPKTDDPREPRWVGTQRDHILSVTTHDPISTQFLWPKTDDPREPRWVGTQRDHILSVTTSGRDVTVIVCEYTFGTASESRFGRGYAPHAAGSDPYAGVDEMRITMTAPAKPALPLPAQQGPARAPSVDVFAGWRITSHQGGWFAQAGVGSDWPRAVEDEDACIVKAPPHPDLVPGEEYDRSLFPTLPASPGWPSTSANA
ncbi:hypothetical protein MSS2_05365 [Mycobacterium marinum]|nr:hypothetical protein MSS2_05365 [Mycobacterium marinum]